MNTELQNHVENIARTLSEGFTDDDLNFDDEPMTAFDYLQDALDIEYVVNGLGEYLGARVLVAFGGPNIWIDTRRSMVDGYWWQDKASASFSDAIGLDDVLSELWNCR